VVAAFGVLPGPRPAVVVAAAERAKLDDDVLLLFS